MKKCILYLTFLIAVMASSSCSENKKNEIPKGFFYYINDHNNYVEVYISEESEITIYHDFTEHLGKFKFNAPFLLSQDGDTIGKYQTNPYKFSFFIENKSATLLKIDSLLFISKVGSPEDFDINYRYRKHLNEVQREYDSWEDEEVKLSPRGN